MQPAVAITYRVSFPAPETRYLRVDAVLPADGEEGVELFLPRWTPGNYRLRDHARRLEGLGARDAGGTPLAIEKSSTSRWRLATGGAREVHLGYEVYAPELEAWGNVVDPSFALVNGAATFVGVAGRSALPHRVELRPPAAWRSLVTTLDDGGGDGAPGALQAADYDELLDALLYLGNPTVRRFEVAGVEHLLVTEGAGRGWDADRAAAVAERVVRETIAFWQGVPYRRYVFLNLVVDGFGGLEHRASSVLLTNRWATRKRDELARWATMAAHELFHAWNGKRFADPLPAGTDYACEVATPELWVTEGITAYYDRLLVHRAGLSTRDELLDHFAVMIRDLQSTPGRLVQTVEEASIDAWVRFFQPDDNNVNSTVSFYRKGALLAWLLDAALRRELGGDGLDDVMREAFRRSGAERPPGARSFERLAVELAGGSSTVADLLARGLRSTAELDYSPALDGFGLELVPAGADGPPARPWLGAKLTTREGRVVVRGAVRGSPAHAAGLGPGDEIVGIAGCRVPPSGVADLLALHEAGDEVELLIARRGDLLPVLVTLSERPALPWRLAVSARATAEQRQRLESWLSGSRRAGP